MPVYEFHCRSCDDTFVEKRPMSASDDHATCPGGHDDTVKVMPALGGSAKAGAGRAADAGASGGGGGCCGGGCCGG